MKYNLTTPCDECPFLKNSGFTREQLEDHARGEFACHKACDVKADEDGIDVFVKRENGKTPHCAGALIYLEKQNRPHQMMRISERLGGYDRTKLNMDAPVMGPSRKKR